MSTTVGIAYTTFNRVKLWHYGFMKLIRTTLQDKKYDYTLSISDDGSRPDELAELEKMVRELQDYCTVIFTTETLANVAHNRNRALYPVKDCDYIFSFEDDVYPFNPNWIDGYITGLKQYPHLMYLPQNMWKNQSPHSVVEPYHIVKNTHCGGIMMAFTRDIIKTVGGFNYDFKAYGYEHAELTERINMHLGYPGNLYLSIKEAETEHWFVSADEKNFSEYKWGLTPEQWSEMDACSIAQRMSIEEKNHCIEQNGHIWMKSRQQSLNGNLYREIRWK